MIENRHAEADKKKELPGNIWGWKFSFISLGIILFFVALMAYRYYSLPDEVRQQEKMEQQRALEADKK